MRKLPETFYPLVASAAQKLRAAKLTASEWTIWSYLVEIDPWGDRYHEVETLEVMEKCKVSKATYYRAIAKFQENEIFDFQDKGFNVRNLNGIDSIKTEKVVSEMRQTAKKSESQSCENSLKIETKVSEMRQLSQNCENRGSKVALSNKSESPQISSDYSEDPEDRSDDFVFFENANSENSQVAIASQNSKIDDASKCNLKPVDKSKDKESPVKVINPIDGDSTRHALENFILKSMSFAPRDRTAYFAKFKAKDWQDWEIKFKPPSSPVFVSNIFVPEIVEIADPDSPKVKDAIAQIKAALGIKEKSKCS